ncbi:type I restriction enzyme, S subunit [Lachnospiraceae bacterium YSD2013]|nr:type I restriction enzyme, S subunit [Lachnospiraceae bacterium YSD2013]
MSNRPNIRFKNFKDDWEQRKLEDVVEFLDTLRKPLEGAKRVSGPYPYYGASGIVDYVDGYIFDEELILLSEDGANITDRNYPVCFLASGKYWVNNHAHVLKCKDGNENNFICNSLERKDYKQYNSGMAMPKLNQEVCRGIPVSCPKYEEQKKIGDYFRSLDNLITLHQRKCVETKALKKYMLQKMFPQEGERVPEIRFDGFTDDWEQRKVSEIADYIDGNYGEKYPKDNEFIDEGIPFFTSAVTGADGVFNKENVKYISEEKNAILLKAQSRGGDLILTNRGASMGVIAEIPQEYGLVNIGPQLTRIRGKEGVAFNKFLLSNLQTSKNSRKLTSMNAGSAMPFIGLSGLGSFELQLPSFEEQKQIGVFFRDLDNLITLQQRKCDELKEVKKYMLQNMFPNL